MQQKTLLACLIGLGLFWPGDGSADGDCCH